MATGTLDTVILVILFATILGFVYIKFLKPWLLPMLVDLWHWMTKKPEQTDNTKKELTFE